MPFVLDSSVALAWLLPDESSASADVVGDRLTYDIAVVPPVWPLEIGNVLLIALRRRRITRAELDEALLHVRDLPVKVDSTATGQALRDTFAMAEARGLTTYDASYLELARRRGLPVATLDRGLREACVAAGIEVIPESDG